MNYIRLDYVDLAFAALLLVGPHHRSNRDTLAARAGVDTVIEVPHLEHLDPASLAELPAVSALRDLLT